MILQFHLEHLPQPRNTFSEMTCVHSVVALFRPAQLVRHLISNQLREVVQAFIIYVNYRQVCSFVKWCWITETVWHRSIATADEMSIWNSILDLFELVIVDTHSRTQLKQIKNQPISLLGRQCKNGS